MKSPTLCPPDTFETPCLRLCRPRMEDAPSIYARYSSDPDVTRHLPWRPHKSVKETQTFLTHPLNSMESDETHVWIVESKEDRRLMGLMSIGIHSARAGDFLNTEEERQYYKVGFAYHLARSEWGQGYATEAARALVDWALNQRQVFRICTVCDVEHAASVRVLEKLGMVREGVLKRWGIHSNVSPEPRDYYCYALTK